MDNAPDELAMFEAAVDRFSEQPVPMDGPAAAAYVARVQRANDKIALKVAEGPLHSLKPTSTTTTASSHRCTG